MARLCAKRGTRLFLCTAKLIKCTFATLSQQPVTVLDKMLYPSALLLILISL